LNEGIHVESFAVRLRWDDDGRSKAVSGHPKFEEKPAKIVMNFSYAFTTPRPTAPSSRTPQPSGQESPHGGGAAPPLSSSTVSTSPLPGSKSGQGPAPSPSPRPGPSIPGSSSSSPSAGVSKRPKKILRAAGGEVWEDPTLAEWDPSECTSGAPVERPNNLLLCR
jgi:hypothetical protein